jgi:hypothetical protein
MVRAGVSVERLTRAAADLADEVGFERVPTARVRSWICPASWARSCSNGGTGEAGSMTIMRVTGHRSRPGRPARSAPPRP